MVQQFSGGAYTEGAGIQSLQQFLPVLQTRAPTSADNKYQVGQKWINTTAGSNAVYFLTSLSSDSSGVTASWTSAGTSSALNTLTGDSGGALTPSAGNISLLGTANQITTTGVGSTITWSLPSVLIAPGSLEVTSGFTIDAGAVTIATGTSAINISADAANTTVNLATGAGAKLLTLGSTNGASALTLHTGTGNFVLDGVAASTYAIGASTTTGTITIGGTAQTGTMTLGSSSGANTLVIAGGSGATTLQIANAQTAGSVSVGAGMTTGTISIGGTGAQTGTITIGGGTGAQTLNLGTGGTGVKTINVGTAAVANVLTIGSTTASASTTIQAGSGTTGISLSAAGNVQMAAATNSNAGTTLTVNSRVGHGVFTGQTTASGASVSLVLTNSVITGTNQTIFVSVDNLGSNDAQMTIQRVLQAANTLTVTLKNNGAAALNGDIHLNWWILD